MTWVGGFGQKLLCINVLARLRTAGRGAAVAGVATEFATQVVDLIKFLGIFVYFWCKFLKN